MENTTEPKLADNSASPLERLVSGQWRGGINTKKIYHSFYLLPTIVFEWESTVAQWDKTENWYKTNLFGCRIKFLLWEIVGFAIRCGKKTDKPKSWIEKALENLPAGWELSR